MALMLPTTQIAYAVPQQLQLTERQIASVFVKHLSCVFHPIHAVKSILLVHVRVSNQGVAALLTSQSVASMRFRVYPCLLSEEGEAHAYP